MKQQIKCDLHWNEFVQIEYTQLESKKMNEWTDIEWEGEKAMQKRKIHSTYAYIQSTRKTD